MPSALCLHSRGTLHDAQVDILLSIALLALLIYDLQKSYYIDSKGITAIASANWSEHDSGYPIRMVLD
jgi:hypothetical protein